MSDKDSAQLKADWTLSVHNGVNPELELSQTIMYCFLQHNSKKHYKNYLESSNAS
jgi:hypothetical protein